jgi:4-amino-4-deoxy-L-arabinose transferase-like glycosyltransferase
MGVHLPDKITFRYLLSEHFPLLSILIGIVLISISIGPFYNPDTQLEYEAASGVLKWGMPYMTTFGNIINQPPVGFYINAVVFKGIGLSLNTGQNTGTLFGLGCTILVYKIGKIMYGKTTGLFAAALFALTPWQMVLSNSFLIDVQCLFFSLLFLLVGIYAIRKDSFKIFMFSGTLFAIAFLTKFYAVFTLIPLALFYVYYAQKNLRRIIAVAAYFLPALFLVFLWYYIVLGRGSISAISIDDFKFVNSTGATPSFLFVGNYLLDGVGALFLVATLLSLLISFSRRKLFARIIPFDLMCIATILAVGSVNTFLAVGLNLNSPYINPIKYDYQFLPLFSLLAASLIFKSFMLLNSVKLKQKLSAPFFSVALVGLVLLGTSMILNMNYMHQFSTWPYLLFRVERNQDIGYSFVNPLPIGKYSPLMVVQYLGFASVISGLLWASRNKLIQFRKLTNFPSRKSNQN